MVHLKKHPAFFFNFYFFFFLKRKIQLKSLNSVFWLFFWIFQKYISVQISARTVHIITNANLLLHCPNSSWLQGFLHPEVHTACELSPILKPWNREKCHYFSLYRCAQFLETLWPTNCCDCIFWLIQTNWTSGYSWRCLASHPKAFSLVTFWLSPRIPWVPIHVCIVGLVLEEYCQGAQLSFTSEGCDWAKIIPL